MRPDELWRGPEGWRGGSGRRMAKMGVLQPEVWFAQPI